MTDRDGVFLAQLNQGPEGYGYWPVGSVPKRVAVAILALEDRRFWDHPGVDPLAVARALRGDLTAGRRVSGASTLAMQVARMQHPEARTAGAKVLEASAALVMTARYGRLGVLRQYLLLAPFGQNGHGIAYAAEWYFARPVGDLSWAQIALLSAIPQAPGLYNLNNPAGLARAKARARVALGRLLAQGVIDGPTEAEALVDLQRLTPRPRLARPAGALEAILAVQARAAPGVVQVHSRLDLRLEGLVTELARRRLASFSAQGAEQVAVLVVDRPDMAVRAMVGSGAYDDVNEGEVDYMRILRSPGSTLKPFIFAQALERGTVAPDSVLLDGPDSGTMVDNADHRFLGNMLVPQALGNSRNVPAAMLVRRLGLPATEAFLTRMGLQDERERGPYGLSIAIGALPTSLTRLVAAYGALANDGVWKPLRWYDGEALPPPVRVVSSATARTVSLFLSDPMARLPSFARMGAVEFPFPVAVKTGTSQGYRDAWVVAYTQDYVVGVWVGRPDGGPMDGLMGANSAAVIGHDILDALYPVQADGQDDISFAAPAGSRPVTVCAQTGTLAAAGCATQLAAYLPAGMAVPAVPDPAPVVPLRIVSPLNHALFFLNPDEPAGVAVLPLRVAPGSGASAVEWFVDGQAFQAAGAGDTVNWPVTPGRHVIAVEDLATRRRAVPVEVGVQ